MTTNSQREVIIDQDDFMQTRPFDLYLILNLRLVVVPIMYEPLSWGTDRARSSCQGWSDQAAYGRLRDLYKVSPPYLSGFESCVG
jgi:hypothetical protein